MNTDTDNWAAFQAALQWQPDPVEIDLLHVHKKERGTDIISMLVAIYGSKELFINEYRCGPSAGTPQSRDERSKSSRGLFIRPWRCRCGVVIRNPIAWEHKHQAGSIAAPCVYVADEVSAMDEKQALAPMNHPSATLPGKLGQLLNL